MKTYLIPVVILLEAMTASAQPTINPRNDIDSLGLRYRQEKNDSSRAVIAFDLVKRLARTDTVKSYSYLQKGKKLIGKSTYLKGLYYFSIAQYCFDFDRERCNNALMKAISTLSPLKTKDSYKLQAKAWVNYVIQNKGAKGDDFAIQTILEKSVPLIEKSGDSLQLADNLFQVGLLFMNNQHYDRASQYYALASNMVARAPHNSPLPLRIMTLWADNYLYTQEYKKAKEKLDEAQQMLKNRAREREYLDYYYAEGVYYNETGHPEKALVSFNKGLSTPKDDADPYVRRTLTFEKVNVLDSLQRYEEGKQLLLNLFQDGRYMETIGNKMLMYHKLAYFEEKLKHYKPAYGYVREYLRLKDSLYTSQLHERISELELKYNDAKNKVQIETLRAENAESRFYTIFLGIGCFVLLAIIIISFLIYRNRKKLAEQKEINYQQQLKQVQQEKDIEVFKALITGEEQERDRIARELHDGLGGLLVGVKLNLHNMYNQQDENVMVREGIGTSIEQLDYSINELRHIASNMIPAALLHVGLEEALEDFCTSLSTDNLPIYFQANNMGIMQLSKHEQLMVFRIVQELVTNALKHASASKILVDYVYNGKRLDVSVEDNGIGFDTHTIFAGMGLKNVRERVQSLGAHLDIDSVKQEGTTVYFYYNL